MCQIYHKWTAHEHKCLSSFLFFRFSSNWDRERERVYKSGYKEKRSQRVLIFFSLMEFLWRIFPLLRANRLYAIFNTGLKKMAPSCPRYSFRLLLPGVLGFGSVRHEPCQTTNFLISFFRWREGGATSVVYHMTSSHLREERDNRNNIGSQAIVWLLPSSPWSGDSLGLLDVISYFNIGDENSSPSVLSLSLSLPSTNIWSPLWPTFFLKGHSLTACNC